MMRLLIPGRLSKAICYHWSLILHVACLLAATTAETPALSSYANSLQLDAMYELYWTADTSASKAKINFAVHAQTKGYVGFGISEVGGMVGTDAMLGWVSNGKAYATDRFIFDRSSDGSGVRLDVQQDWVVVGGEESVNGSTGETWTTIHFWRYLDTGDVNDRPILSGRKMQIVWSLGPYDQLSYHGSNKGSSPVLFIPVPGLAVTTPDPPESFINLAFSSYNVPNNYTNYICKKFELDISQKLHIIQTGAILNGTKTSAVHHYILNACTKSSWDQAPAGEWSCLEGEFFCGSMIAGWAVGGKPFNFPAEAGMPLTVTRRYLVLQMHYTNPDGASDIFDSSGASLGVTTKLRQYDSDIMMTGPVIYNPLIRIPPFRSSWTQTTRCPSACTEKGMTGSIFIFSSSPHMHTLGRKMYTKVFRGGQEITTLDRQDYYDFNFQQTTEIYPPFELKPGDSMETQCVWDSSRKRKATPGGPGTSQEMGIHFLNYYPRQNGPRMDVCFDICAKFIPSIPKLLPDGLPLLAPKGVRGMQLLACNNDLWTKNETCTSEGFGINKPRLPLFGRKRRSVCSTCMGLIRRSSAPAKSSPSPHSGKPRNLWNLFRS